jgi:hypothetical protein
MSSAWEGVRPEVREFWVMGKPLGRRKRRLLVLAGAGAGGIAVSQRPRVIRVADTKQRP